VLQDVVGIREETCEQAALDTVGGVFDAYATRFPRLRKLRRSILLARNQHFCDDAVQLADGDEIAFLPPVSGGSDGVGQQMVDAGGHFFVLTRDPIDTSALVSRVRQDIDGAVVVFEGVVRNKNHGKSVRCLEYDCYEEMAIRSMAELGVDLAHRHEISRFAMVHRLGQVPVGEASVVVVVAAPHRKPAFSAAMEAMDRLKSEVPIWKKEHFENGAIWPAGDWSEALLHH
jgi:molybdopterin synthase catalytic subunit